MADATINSNVGVNVNPSGMAGAAKTVEKSVLDIVKAIEKAGTAANDQLKSLAIGMKQLDTLRTANAKLVGGEFSTSQGLGRQARALAEYRAGISKTSDAMGVLRARSISLEVANGKLFAQSKVPNKNSVLNAQKIEQTAVAYGKLTSQVNGLRGRIALMDDASKKAFAPMLAQFDKIDKKNAGLFGQSSRVNFKPQLDQMQRMTANLSQQVGLTEKRTRAEKANLETVRAQAQAILSRTTAEREAQLAGAVRGANREFSNRALIGGQDFNRNVDQSARLVRATSAAATAQNKLNVELSKPAAEQNAAAIAKLTGQYDRLVAAQGRAIAGQTRVNGEQAKAGAGNQGGFFAGVKSVGANLFDKPEGSGSAFGAGALVGRVATYAVAASAIYGLITSIKEGISFTIEFEDALAQLQAISGSTATEMDRLSAGIFKVASNSVNSVMELTKSATIIAQAGYAGAELQEMLQSVVNLSAASGASPEESVDILTGALGAFQLSAGEASRVTDVLVSTLNESKLTVGQVQQSLQYLGNTAAANNVSLEELVATTASLADAGVRGSTAATGLRQMMVDFMDPSEKMITQLERIGLSTKDIDVKVLGLNTVLGRLRDAGFEAYGSMETRAAAAYVAASRNIENTERLLTNAQQLGTAEAAAETRASSLTAQWQQMLNQLANLGNELGKNFLPLMKILLDITSAVVMSFGALAVAITLPLRALGLLGEETDYLGLSLKEATASFEAAGLSAEEAAVRASAMGEGLDDVTTALKDTEAEISSVTMEQASLRTETEKLIMKQGELAGANGNLNETTTGVSAAVSNLSGRFPGLRGEFEKTQGGIAGLIQAMMNLDRQAQVTLRNLAQTGLAQADMERKASLKELGAVSARSAKMGGNIGTPLDRMKNPKLVKDQATFRALMKQNNTTSLQQAHRLLMDNPQLQKMNATTYQALTKSLGRYTTARQDTDIKKEQLGVADFALSKPGQELTKNMRYDAANSTFTKSQGSASERAALQQTLKGREARYDQLEKELKDNPYAASLLDAARSSTRAAYNRLSPEEEKEKKKAGGGGGKSAAERAASKREREGQRREKEIDRIDGKIKKEELELRKEQYDNAVDAFKNAPDLGGVDELLDTVDTALTTWLEAEAETALQEIEALNPTAQQRTKMMATAGRKADELRISEINKLGDTLAGVIKEYIDTTTKSIERQYDTAMQFTERNVALAQARLEGLNNPLSNDIPDYMKTVMQRRLDEANDQNQRASQGAGENRLTNYRNMQAKVLKDKEEVEARLAQLGRTKPQSGTEEIVVVAALGEARRELRGLDDDLLELNDAIYDQDLALQALAARYGVMSEAPRGFGEGLRMALEAVKIDIGAASNLGQELINNIDQPLRAVHEGFKGFFSDVLSGTTSLSQAFKNMAGSIIDSILEMVAVALANQFFSLIAGMFGPAPQGRLMGSVASTQASNPGIFWNGGQIKAGGSGTVTAKRMYGGGQIDRGTITRDSTLIHAAKNEYMIRQPAAESLGKGFLDAINARGAGALKGMGQTNIIAPQGGGGSPVNVYVVAPEEKPTLGPNDILATFSSDVLRGGVTKKLIQQVAAGG